MTRPLRGPYYVRGARNAESGRARDDDESDVALVFPPLAAPYASDNDLSGLEVTSLDVTAQLGDGDYVFTGNAITINAGSPGPNDVARGLTQSGVKPLQEDARAAREPTSSPRRARRGRSPRARP